MKYLHTEIGKILGLEEKHNLIIIGAGQLGQALVKYSAFEKRGFIFKALFDINPELKGTKVCDIEIHMMDELERYIKENNIEIAVLTIPKDNARNIADVLAECGVKGIWNFAHLDLNLPDHIVVENVHLSDSLMRLSYNISRYNQEHEEMND